MRRLSTFRWKASLAFVFFTTACSGSGSGDSGTDPLATLGVAEGTIQQLAFTEYPDGRLDVGIELDGVPCILELGPYSNRATGFQLFLETASSLDEVTPPASCTLRGTVEGNPARPVAASYENGRFCAVAMDWDASVWVVQPAPNAGSAHAVFRPEDMTPLEIACGALGTGSPVPQAMGGGTTLAVAELAIDTDVELFTRNGSDIDATINDVEMLVNAVNLIYERDVLIRHVITAMIIRTSEPDPYYSFDVSDLKEGLEYNWKNIFGHVQRDTVHLISGKQMPPGAWVGVSPIPGICDFDEGYAVSTWLSPNFCHRATLIAHELGHQWGSDHCDGTVPCRIMCSSLYQCGGGGSAFSTFAINGIVPYKNGLGCLVPSNLPDLQIEQIVAAAVQPGTDLNFTFAILNDGDVDAVGIVDCSVILSLNHFPLDGDDVMLGIVSVDLSQSPLTPGASRSVSATVHIPQGVQNGGQQLFVCVDTGLPPCGSICETNEFNQCGNVDLAIGSAPNLQTRIVSAPSNWPLGFSQSVDVEISNTGTLPMYGQIGLALWMTLDGVASGAWDDIPMGVTLVDVGVLDPGEAQTFSATSLQLPVNAQVGDQYLVACVDSGFVVFELDEDDNCASKQVKVLVPVPQVEIKSISVGSPMCWGQNSAVSLTFENVGTGTAFGFNFTTWLSLDTDPFDWWDFDNIPMGGWFDPQQLAPGQTKVITFSSLPVPFNALAGNQYFIGCVDTGGPALCKSKSVKVGCP